MTWIAQREHFAQVVKAEETHKVVAHFITSIAVLGNTRLEPGTINADTGAGNHGFDMVGEWTGLDLEDSKVHGNVGVGPRKSQAGTEDDCREF